MGVTTQNSTQIQQEAFDPDKTVTKEQRRAKVADYEKHLIMERGECASVRNSVNWMRTSLELYEDIIPEIRTSDVGNATRLAEQYGDRIRFNWTTGQWLYFDGTRWNSKTGKAAAKKFAFQVARVILEEGNRIQEPNERKNVIKWSLASESSQKISAMLELAKAIPPIECYADAFDQDKFLLNIVNGTLDLRTGKLRDHDPADMLSKLAPVVWNGEKSSFDGNQLWLLCLRTWMNDSKDAIDYLQRLGGMCLTGDISSRVFPIFWGTGKNGKNSYLDTIMQLLGDYATVAPRSLLRISRNEEHPTELAGLVGSRFVIASETKRNMRLKTALVKSFTGDAKLKARFMRQEYFDFTPTFKVILMTQNLPIIDEVTDAIWDRVHKVEWSVRIPDNEQDDKLGDKLASEWPYILGWLVEGCLKWQKDGHLNPTDAIRKGTAAYQREMNPLKEFIEECCQIGEGFFIPVRELKKSYDDWSTDKKQMNSRDFNSYMRESGYNYSLKRIGEKPIKCWMGIGLNPSDSE